MSMPLRKSKEGWRRDSFGDSLGADLLRSHSMARVRLEGRPWVVSCLILIACRYLEAEKEKKDDV